MEFEPGGVNKLVVLEDFGFPSPCGVMEFEHEASLVGQLLVNEFPSPCGVMEFEPKL